MAPAHHRAECARYGARGQETAKAAGEIPIPGGVGAVEGGLIGALALYGIPVSVATAGTLAYGAIALGIPDLFGGLAAIALAHTVRGWDQDEPVPARADVG